MKPAGVKGASGMALGGSDELGDGVWSGCHAGPSGPRAVGEEFAGILVTDRYSAYNWYP